MPQPASFVGKAIWREGWKQDCFNLYLYEEKPWISVGMDFISGFPKMNNLFSVTVVMDKFSKYEVFIAVPESFTAETIADLFHRNVVKHFGVSNDIMSDWDAWLVLDLFGQLARFRDEVFYCQPSTDGWVE